MPLGDFIRDLRHAFRLLSSAPGVSFVAVLSLALGIGANVTLFTFFNAIFFRPLPVTAPAELVGIYSTDPAFPGLLQSAFLNLRDLAAAQTVFSGVATTLATPLNLTGGTEPERLNGELVSSNYFALLGAHTQIGRTFAQNEDKLNASPVVILSDAFWRRKYGKDPHILGKILKLNATAYTVAGVMDPSFPGLRPFAGRDVWVPMGMRDTAAPSAVRGWFDIREALMMDAVARLKPGVSLERARAAVKTLARNLEQQYPKDNHSRGMDVAPLTALDPNAIGTARRVAIFLMAMVGLLLLLACFNVANLLLSRALARRREVAIRLAIGAGRQRLVRQLLTESLLLALLGGVAGLLLAFWGRGLLWNALPAGLPGRADVAFDPRVLGFALALTLLTAVLFGIAPALQTLHSDLVGALKSGAVAAQSRRRFGLRELLVVCQIALSLVLLVGTGLLLRSLRQAQAVDPGFAAERLLTVSFDLPAAGYTPERGLDFCRRVVERMRGVPGVRSASVALNRPLFPAVGGRFYLEGHAQPSPRDGAAFLANGVDSSYFTTLGMRIVRGRAFTAADTGTAPFVVIINQTLADRFLKKENPLGQRVHLVGSDAVAEIVGVAPDAKYIDLRERPQPYIFIPLAQNFAGETTLFVQAAGNPAAILESVRRAVQALDADLPLLNVRTVSSVVRDSLSVARANATMLAIFGVLGLVLATVGTYGVMAFTVDQRRREIGIHMALGAQRGSVLTRILLHGLVLIGAGLLLGLLAAFGASRFIVSLLYNVGVLDLPTFLIAPLALAAAAFLATLLPARRATGVDPVKVLRTE